LIRRKLGSELSAVDRSEGRLATAKTGQAALEDQNPPQPPIPH